MAAVYSKRLIQAQGLTASATATVPAGVLWIVRDADFLILPGIGSVQVVLSITAPGPVQTAIYYHVTSSDEYDAWRGRQVLYEGEELEVAVSGSGAVDATVSGYELTLP